MNPETIRPFPARPRKAIADLCAADPALARVIDAAGPFQIKPRPADLTSFCHSIIGQQLSMAVARKICERFDKCAGERDALTPASILKLKEEDLRAAGLSGAKVIAVRSLAEFWKKEKMSESKIAAMSDDDLIKGFTTVKGIGPWTVKMILIFSLRRPDVLPVEDLGLRMGIKKIYGLEVAPTPKEIPPIAEKWRPWRSIATWYCWRALEL